MPTIQRVYRPKNGLRNHIAKHWADTPTKISTVYFRPGAPAPKKTGITRRNRDEMLAHKEALVLATQLFSKEKA